MKYFLGCFFIASFSFGCKSGTTIGKSWRDPSTQIRVGHFNKILVVAFVKDSINRKKVEDEMVKSLGTRAVASYQYLGNSETSFTVDGLSNRLKADGIEGAVVMQLVNPERELGYTPGSGNYPAQYNSFYNHYEGAGNTYRGREYYKNLNTYAVETNVYSLADNKLIWSGITSSYKPKDINRLVSTIGKVVISEMKKQGFLF
jgi:hypothetical protein